MQTGYVMRLGDGSLLTPMAQVSYSDKYWSFDYNVPGSEQKAYAKTDLRLRWKNEKKGITVEGFVTTGAGMFAVQSALKPLGAV